MGCRARFRVGRSACPRSGRPRRRSRTGARRSRRGDGHGAAERDEGRHRHRGGNAEQRAHVVLLAHRHGGHDAAEALGPGRQQQAPDEGVDGGAAGEGVAGRSRSTAASAVRSASTRRRAGAFERLGEAGRGGAGLGEGRRVGNGLRLGRPVGHRRPGHQAGRPPWPGTRTSRAGRGRAAPRGRRGPSRR